MSHHRSSGSKLAVLLLVVPLLGFLALAVWLISGAVQEKQQADRSIAAAQLDSATHRAVRDLQVERGTSQLVLTPRRQ